MNGQEKANLQDELIGALIGLARASDGHEPATSTHKAMIEGLFTTLTNVNFNEETILSQIDTVRQERDALISGCYACASSGSRNDAYDMTRLWSEHEDIRSLKSLILFGLKGIAAYAYHAFVLGYSDEDVNSFFYEGLFAVGEDLDMEQLLPTVMKVGEINLKCMALLDRANTESYGHPVPTEVPLTVEKGPFIVISGHDLGDLQLLLEQTKGKEIHIYTHGEMLPAHAYPLLKKYTHLKGNFGTAWQNQQKEFANPRIMDMGQCNDAYSAIKVALALAEAFDCGVNDLPLTLVLSCYEQKAVCILLTLLHLGIKNIYLGPTLPAFLSPNVVDFLVKNFEITASLHIQITATIRTFAGIPGRCLKA